MPARTGEESGGGGGLAPDRAQHVEADDVAAAL
jgi:hypothetical protein